MDKSLLSILSSAGSRFQDVNTLFNVYSIVAAGQPSEMSYKGPLFYRYPLVPIAFGMPDTGRLSLGQWGRLGVSVDVFFVAVITVLTTVCVSLFIPSHVFNRNESQGAELTCFKKVEEKCDTGMDLKGVMTGNSLFYFRSQ